MNSRPLVVGKGTARRSAKDRNTWHIRHNIGGKDPVTGKYRKSPWRTVYAKNKSELNAALEDYKRELNQGIASQRSKVTVREYSEEFHALRQNTMGSPLSYKRERLEIDHICELVGDYPVQDLRTQALQRAYADARKIGRFSASELHKVHTKLKQILRSAVADGIIASNPCDGISVPRPEPKERESLTAEDASRLRHCLLQHEPDAHIVATLLLLETGMRRGEVLGLTWEDVSLADKSVYVSEQFAADKDLRAPKSRKSKRKISISDDLAKRLADWQADQRESLARLGIAQDGETPVAHVLRDRMTGGRAKTKNHSGEHPVEVAHMDPNNFGRWFREFASDNGFGEFTEVTHYVERDGRRYARGKGYTGLTPHMLRHTQATLLIGAKTDIKTVSSRLGHSTVRLTLDTYAHAIEANDRTAADTISRLIS